jgi:hypothetical protein
MEALILQRRYEDAFNLIVEEIEDHLESKDEFKELFSFVLSTYW